MGIQMLRTLSWVCGASILWCPPAVAEELFSQLGSVKAYLADDFKCGEKVRIKLAAESREFFFKNKESLEQIVGGVRAALGFRCDNISDILINGTDGSTSVYAAVTSKSNQWSILEVPLSIVAESVQAAPDIATNVPSQSEPQPNNDVTALALPPASGETVTSQKTIPSTLPDPAIKTSPTDQASTGIEQFRDIKKAIDTGNFSTDLYKMSGLMTALFLGRTEDIPDDQETRAVIFSILAIFSQNCGEAPARVALMAARYGSPQMRAMDRDPLNGAAAMFLDLYNMGTQGLDNGDFMGAMADYADKNAMMRTEGQSDGRIFLSRHGCQSREYDKFSQNLYQVILDREAQEPSPFDQLAFSMMMSPEFRAQKNIPDPAVELQKRKTAEARKKSEISCNAQFSKGAFCKCAMGKLTEAKLSPEIWADLSGKFMNITRHPQLRPILAQCQ